MLALTLALVAPGEIYIQPMASYATPTHAHLTGRVLDGTPPPPPDPDAHKLENVIDNLAALESDEVPGAVVTVRLFGKDHRATTDAEGIFVFDLTGKPALALGRIKAPARLASGATADLEIDVLADAPGIAIISDVDDTVVLSHVTDPKRMLKTALTKNAAQLTPAPGMPETYRTWRDAGARGFFYVSGSPHNFYPRLRAFLELSGYPLGPIFVRDLDGPEDQRAYKQARIAALFAFFPKLRFVLVGDSGEADPDIYREVRRANPTRVVAIVIRELASRPVGSADDLVVVPEGGADPHQLAKVMP